MRISDWSSDVCSSDLDGIALDAEVDEISDRAVRKKLAGKDFRRFPRTILRLRDSDGQAVAACAYKESLALRADSIICGVQNLEFDFMATVDESLAPFLEEGAEAIDGKSTRLNSSHYCVPCQP